MSDCCDDKIADFHNDHRHRKILWILLLINAVMFLVELVAGLLVHSTSLLADSADMFADAFVYGVSLVVVGKSTYDKARVSLFKGIIMSLLGLVALTEAVSKILSGTQPDHEVMGVIGFLALIANFTCAFLLLKHKDDDINMKSTWICSRNDVIANVGILVAAGLVYLTQSNLPDAIIGSAIYCATRD